MGNCVKMRKKIRFSVTTGPIRQVHYIQKKIKSENQVVEYPTVFQNFTGIFDLSDLNENGLCFFSQWICARKKTASTLLSEERINRTNRFLGGGWVGVSEEKGETREAVSMSCSVPVRGGCLVWLWCGEEEGGFF